MANDDDLAAEWIAKYGEYVLREIEREEERAQRDADSKKPIDYTQHGPVFLISKTGSIRTIPADPVENAEARAERAEAEVARLTALLAKQKG